MTREELLELLTTAATIGRNGDVAHCLTRGEIADSVAHQMHKQIAAALPATAAPWRSHHALVRVEIQTSQDVSAAEIKDYLDYMLLEEGDAAMRDGDLDLSAFKVARTAVLEDRT